MTATILPLLEPDGATVGQSCLDERGAPFAGWHELGIAKRGNAVAAYGGSGHARR